MWSHQTTIRRHLRSRFCGIYLDHDWCTQTRPGLSNGAENRASLYFSNDEWNWRRTIPFLKNQRLSIRFLKNWRPNIRFLKNCTLSIRFTKTKSFSKLKANYAFYSDDEWIWRPNIRFMKNQRLSIRFLKNGRPNIRFVKNWRLTIRIIKWYTRVSLICDRRMKSCFDRLTFIWWKLTLAFPQG